MTIATTEQSNTPALVPVGSVGGNLIREAASVMADAHMLAKAVCNTAMVPKHFQGKPDDTAAAMLYGSSLGLDPMQAVRAIYIVHGSPGLYAKSMAGLAAARGHETWTIESTDESVTVAGRRKGSEHVEQSTWTIERATKAGYVPTIDPATGKFRLNKWGKVDGNEKYLTDPQAMLHAKALAEVCRKIAPDVLAGVYSVEELQSEQRFTVEQVPTRGLAAVLAPQTSGADGAGDESALPVRGDGDSAPEPDPITSAQLTKVGILCGELGLTDPAEARREVGAVIGREIKSRKELTKAEAHRVIDRFTVMVEQPFPSEPVDGEIEDPS
jgi:hypothetical protein